jgi:hypothetical protein
VVTLAVAAWWAPKMPVHVRATVVLYSALFLFVGLPFNTYWGELIAPLVGLWMVYIPEGLSTVWAGAQLSRTSRCSTLTGTERIPLTAGLDN